MKFLQPLNLFKESLKREASKRNQLLGLNVGESPNISSKSCPIYSYISGLHKMGKLEGLMYSCWDENFTSKHVEFVSNHHVEFIKSLNLPKHFSEKCIEKFAAWHMLQGYLDYSNMLVAIEKDDADLFGGN
ncbi:hypothetical protein Dsin_020956 [Dipteronia sinensis]|uniref:Uncharacterized protein n=1 Tax=Dipteronia sinensis TaxID=43782 RepID=A0AAE0AA99_9ROSI|nr:hypothetical protein Dsin_020956 [Dipteronia sinensis]